MFIEYLTLGIYFLLLLVVGAIFSRLNSNLSDFVRGGSRGTWWMVGTSITMSGISAFTFTGNGSSAFEAGPSLLVIYLANLAGLALGGLFLAAWYRQTRANTGVDVIRGRFGTVVEQFSIFVGLMLTPLGSAIQLWALAVFVSSVFGLPLETMIVLSGAVVLIYSVSGGQWAVMANDVLQGVVLYGITILVGLLALKEIGGLSGFVAHFSELAGSGAFAFVKPEGSFPDNKYTLQWAIVVFLMQFFTQIQLGTAGRYLAVKDGREGSRAAWWAFALMAVGTTIWFLPPMVARFLFEAEVRALAMSDPATGAYAVVARHVLPDGLMGIMIAAMFAATMSSMDSGLNGQTSVIVNNLIGRIREAMGLGPMADRTALRVCRLVSSGLGLLIIGISLLLARQKEVSLFDTFLFIGSIISTPIVIPLLAGLIFRSLPSWSYFLIFGAAVIPSFYSFFLRAPGAEPWTIQERGMWVIIFGAAGVAVGLALGRFRSESQRERARKFFERMETPVDFSAEVGGGNDGRQARLVGRVILTMGLLMSLLLLLPNPWTGRLAILALVAFVASVGGLLIWAASRESRASGVSGIPAVPEEEPIR